jgi:hypothetical protein
MSSTSSWLDSIPPRIGYYLAGFVDGEGSFIVSVRRRTDHAMGWQVDLTFNVSQKERHILAYFKRYLGCGRFQQRPDGIFYFVVSNQHAIHERVIPFFERFAFLSQRKQSNFAIFKKVASIVAKQEHLTQSGLEQIMHLRERLNEGKGRTRKYSLSDYQASQGESSETIR